MYLCIQRLLVKSNQHEHNYLNILQREDLSNIVLMIANLYLFYAFDSFSAQES
jgi:hypothetical protein